MMIHAYQEIYLSKVQSVLGDAFDYALHSCKLSGETFIKLFITSSFSKRIENGEPAYLAGKSGIELVMDIVLETMGKELNVVPQESMHRSQAYWIGWAIAYYQWYSSRKFSDIFEVLSFEDLSNMYYTLHEADITKFVDIVDEQMKAYFPNTNLSRIRNAYGCTQAELANRSGVSLRSIQMYEQRQKNINRARVESLYKMAKVLGCTIEDLIETSEI